MGGAPHPVDAPRQFLGPASRPPQPRLSPTLAPPQAPPQPHLSPTLATPQRHLRRISAAPRPQLPPPRPSRRLPARAAPSTPRAPTAPRAPHWRLPRRWTRGPVPTTSGCPANEVLRSRRRWLLRPLAPPPPTPTPPTRRRAPSPPTAKPLLRAPCHHPPPLLLQPCPHPPPPEWHPFRRPSRLRQRPMELGQWLQMLLHHLHSPRLSPLNRPVLRLSPRARRGCPSRTPDSSPLRALTLRAAATGRDARARLHFCK